MKKFTLEEMNQAGCQLTEQMEPREQLAHRLPVWMQPAITWLSGKALTGQQPMIPALCTPVAKIFVAATTIAVGLAFGVNAVTVLTYS